MQQFFMTTNKSDYFNAALALMEIHWRSLLSLRYRVAQSQCLFLKAGFIKDIFSESTSKVKALIERLDFSIALGCDVDLFSSPFDI